MEDPKCPRCGSNEVKKVKTKLRLSYPLVALILIAGTIITGITETPWGLIGAVALIVIISVIQNVRNKNIAYIFCKICGKKWEGEPEISLKPENEEANPSVSSADSSPCQREPNKAFLESGKAATTAEGLTEEPEKNAGN